MNYPYIDSQNNDDGDPGKAKENNNNNTADDNPTTSHLKDEIYSEDKIPTTISIAKIHSKYNLITIAISKSFLLQTCKVVAIVISIFCTVGALTKLKTWHLNECQQSFVDGVDVGFKEGMSAGSSGRTIRSKKMYGW